MMLVKAAILQVGQERLANIAPASEGIALWQAYLMNYRSAPEYRDDCHIWLACKLALASVAQGNFGVGCVLVSQSGEVVKEAGFHPAFCSDRHAEKVVMDNFEDTLADRIPSEEYTLITSLELSDVPNSVMRIHN